MLLHALKTCILRDLASLGAELDGYPDDASVWAMPAGVSNSTGTLVLHCCGNLRHFIGAVLTNSSYVRDRDAEFNTRDISRAELHTLLAVSIDEVSYAFDQLRAHDFPPIMPIKVGGGHPRTTSFLVHLVAHLAYHLGQADVHRRVVTGECRPVGTMGVAELLVAEPS